MLDHRSLIGSILDSRYLLISVIGRGGTAVVFNAYDRKLGVTVAIKLLNESLVPSSERPSLRKQFAEEARVLSKLSHPGIVAFKGANLRHDPMYFVMEYADGITLKDHILRKRTLTQKEIIDLSCQILSALEHVHDAGVVHCDIKPHNVILMRNGRIKLTDFGIARTAGKMPDLPRDKAVGTVYYVSSEQAEGKILDHRSDLYSLGIMIYEMATGVLPFSGDDLDRVAEMHAVAPPRRPRTINPDVSKGLEQIILKAIAKKPYMRFSDAREMISYLELLRKNPRSVFRLQNRTTETAAVEGGRHRTRSAYAVLIGTLAAFVLVSAISVPIIYNVILKGTLGDSVSLTVPDLRGTDSETAVKRIDDRYYDVDIVCIYGLDVAPGTVVAQSPSPNSTVSIDPFKEQCEIILSVSAAPCELTMIDVISLSPEEASAALRREGYSVTFQQKYSDTVTKGLCCGTFPAAGEKIAGGSEIILYVSLGYENKS